MARQFDLSPTIHEELRETEFGSLEDLTMDEIRINNPEWWVRYRDREDLDVDFPGGETRRQFFDRVHRAFAEILSTGADRDLIIVSHGSVLATYLANLHDGRPHHWPKYHGSNCSVTVLDHVKSPPAVLQLNSKRYLNDSYRDSAS